MKVEMSLDGDKLRISLFKKRLYLATREGRISLPLKPTKIRTLISVLHRISKNLEEVEEEVE